MSASVIIQKSLAAFLMLVFALGITPKRALHNVIATHKDAQVAKHDHLGACVGKTTFNCQCDNLVAESAFVATIVASETQVTEYFSNYTSAIFCQPCTTSFFSYSLRGPPAC